MPLKHLKQIKLLTEQFLKNAVGSSPKMTGIPRRMRHLIHVGSLTWKIVDVEYNKKISLLRIVKFLAFNICIF